MSRKYKEIEEDIYPESDGKPMADNTLQYEWIVKIKEGLEIELPNDFVAGDLLWYPVKGKPKLSQAPDVMVAIGRPKGYRGSYKQWLEDNIAPQVVFEILSPGNNSSEMAKKLAFYETHGVEEYYVYNPFKNEFFIWLRDSNNQLNKINFVGGWTSPRLSISFQLSNNTFTVFHSNGEAFLSTTERFALVNQERTEKERERAEKERLKEKLRQLGIDPEAI